MTSVFCCASSRLGALITSREHLSPRAPAGVPLTIKPRFASARSSAWCRRSSAVPIAKAPSMRGAAITTEAMQRPEAESSVPLAKRLPKMAVLTVAALAAASLVPAPAVAAGPADVVRTAVSFCLHLDEHLVQLIAQWGNAVYGILFAIVFCETGLVVTPFLPGDSLLFAAGALAALGSLQVPLLVATFLVAAILGDGVNYALGNWIGTKAVNNGWLDKSYLQKTERFYEKHGGKAVVLARFVPIVRTFAPFVAGIGSMAYSAFALYNVVGAVVWVTLFTGAGYLFGNLPAVQHNFTLVVLGIVAVSVLPVLWEIWQARKEKGDSNADGTVVYRF